MSPVYCLTPVRASANWISSFSSAYLNCLHGSFPSVCNTTASAIASERHTQILLLLSGVMKKHVHILSWETHVVSGQ